MLLTLMQGNLGVKSSRQDPLRNRNIILKLTVYGYHCMLEVDTQLVGH